MKKYLIEWETCLCEDFPEQMGNFIVEAENEKEAKQKAVLPFYSVIIGIREVNE